MLHEESVQDRPRRCSGYEASEGRGCAGSGASGGWWSQRASRRGHCSPERSVRSGSGTAAASATAPSASAAPTAPVAAVGRRGDRGKAAASAAAAAAAAASQLPPVAAAPTAAVPAPAPESAAAESEAESEEIEMWLVADVYELLGFALDQNLACCCLSAEMRAASRVDEELKDFHSGPSCLVRAKFQLETDPSITKVDTQWIFHWELSEWQATQSVRAASLSTSLASLKPSHACGCVLCRTQRRSTAAYSMSYGCASRRPASTSRGRCARWCWRVQYRRPRRARRQRRRLRRRQAEHRLRRRHRARRVQRRARLRLRRLRRRRRRLFRPHGRVGRLDRPTPRLPSLLRAPMPRESARKPRRKLSKSFLLPSSPFLSLPFLLPASGRAPAAPGLFFLYRQH